MHVDRWRALKQFFATTGNGLVILVPGIGLLWGLKKRRQRTVRAGFAERWRISIFQSPSFNNDYINHHIDVYGRAVKMGFPISD